MKIDADRWNVLIEHITAVAPDLVIVCRWLACGPGKAPLILGPDIEEPSRTDFSRLIGVLDKAPTEASDAGRALLAEHSRGLAELEGALALLIEARETEWAHPTEVLGRPCPDFAGLRDVCSHRLKSASGGRRQHLETVFEKLERAAKVEATARRRRADSREALK